MPCRSPCAFPIPDGYTYNRTSSLPYDGRGAKDLRLFILPECFISRITHGVNSPRGTGVARAIPCRATSVYNEHGDLFDYCAWQNRERRAFRRNATYQP